MKRILQFAGNFLFLSFLSSPTISQNLDCNFKDPLVNYDFGNATLARNVNEVERKNYQLFFGSCPNDGNYSFTSYTGNCFNGNWITLIEDHTTGDYLGKMMLVNASEKPGVFFMSTINNLAPNKTYEIAAWIVNICKRADGCIPTPPDINFLIETTSGLKLADFNTGLIRPTGSADWQRYYGQFTTPANITAIVFKMEDITPGGCGNDFAIDDIVLKECKAIVHPINERTKEVVTIKQNKITEQPIAKSAAVQEIKPIAKKIDQKNVTITKTTSKEKPIQITPEIKEHSINTILPKVLIDRSNPVVKKIEIPATELLIELYDNGEIDGDTVSIYHNNKLIVSKAGLSEKPISFRLKVNKLQPHHELIMVAENLGSIPPNTSLMIITANENRYEIFISSSEQKNAKVMIDLKE
jgi:hypothetical protein